ncbi:MAG: transposase [Planctomycetes bacterium]|nr:transposase [Planctomycetota bacterium]
MGEAARRIDLQSYEESIPQLTVWDLKPTLESFKHFTKRYEPCLYRKEQRKHFRAELRGLLSDLPRKTIEPIAFDHHQPDYLLQHFVGAGLWDDEKVLAEFHEQVVEESGDPHAGERARVQGLAG